MIFETSKKERQPHLLGAAGGELHPAPKNFLLFTMHYIPCIHILQLFFPCCRFKFLLWPPEAMYVPLPPAWGQRFHKPFYDMHLTTAVLLLSASPEE